MTSTSSSTGASTSRSGRRPVVDSALAQMTLHEKVGQLNQRMLGWTALRRTADGFALTEEALAEIERWQGLGGLYAPLRADAWSGQSWTNGGIRPQERAEALATVQDAVRGASRHGIGALISEEAPHGHQALGGTVLPVNLAAAAAWDPEALEDASRAVAAELAASGAHLALVSALDVLRDGRWGRSEETFGEDPLLAAELTAAIVRGMQGEDRELLGTGGVGVVLKHLAAQGEAIGGRNGHSAHIGPHDLEDIHLPPVRAGLEAGALGFMAAYNDIDGVPCCANHALLTGLLREEHGFDGLVMADMFAVDRLAGMTGDLSSAGRAGLLAGVDMSLCDEGFTTLADLARTDARLAAQIDVAAGRVLEVKDRFGLLEAPQDGAASAPERIALAQERTRAASRRLARESLVLLGDEDADGGRTLPLDPAGLRHLLVTGPYAEDVPCMLGDYVAPQAEGTALSIAEALRRALPGTDVDSRPAASAQELPEAADLEGTDAIVVVIGGTSHRSYDDEFASNGAIDGRAGAATGGEGVDRADISLPGEQDALLRHLAGIAPARTPIIGVVVSGRPHVLTTAAASTQALIWAGYPGPSGGEVVADLLLGAAPATGRLPMTLPSHPAVLPLRYNDRQDAGVYQDVPEPVLFGFGHGLHDRSWAVTEADVQVVGAAGELVQVEVTVEHGGMEPCPAVISVFGRRQGGARIPRRRELLAFVRAELEPGTQSLLLTGPLERFLADPADPLSRTELDIEGLRRTLAAEDIPEGTPTQ